MIILAVLWYDPNESWPVVPGDILLHHSFLSCLQADMSIAEVVWYIIPTIVSAKVSCYCNTWWLMYYRWAATVTPGELFQVNCNYVTWWCITGELLPELLTSLVLLQLKAPTVLHLSSCVPMLQSLLDILDRFNQLAPGLIREERDDLAWSGVWSK